MQDRKYLLSIEELLKNGEEKDREALMLRCLKWLDTERRSRVKRLIGKEDMEGAAVLIRSSAVNRKLAENIGSGLLLQLAVIEAEAGSMRNFSGTEIRQLTISGVVTMLEQSKQEPLPLEYNYGVNGKPYLKNYPYYFNLSHSGEYIFCAVSFNEIGVDIQWEKPLKNDRVARRFFSEEEKKALAACGTEQERQQLFYRLWACKEAYGKLTGQGIAATLERDMGLKNNTSHGVTEAYYSGSLQKFILEEYQIEDYQIAVCKWKQES